MVVESSQEFERVTSLVKDRWEAVLNLDDIEATDDFFLLGGHSLLAVRLIAGLRDDLGIALPVSMIFEHPLFGDFCHHIAKQS
ncbi:hypothetical protein KTJ89_06760 [Brevibacterium sediminis]|uniref:phosphopantetheine-binding protein n=1 Tax=Brevibacterium sediminis TaxID=1857024 RepID=UPI002174DE91|nr:phosphopantetheine-binding protein [Brevibacterium sediminis]MCS4592684.1 hypothetical protein [Brevibacterium sediminis]